MSFGKHRGTRISPGVSILHEDYDISLDQRPESLAKDFKQQVDYNPETANIKTVAQDLQNYVEDTIEHVNAIARNREASPEVIDSKRVSTQRDGDTLKLSNVWEGAWEDKKAGTCQERALTLQAMYNEFNIESQYHTGGLKLDDGRTAQHAWTTVNNQYISDPSANGEDLTPIDETDRYIEHFFWTK